MAFLWYCNDPSLVENREIYFGSLLYFMVNSVCCLFVVARDNYYLHVSDDFEIDVKFKIVLLSFRKIYLNFPTAGLTFIVLYVGNVYYLSLDLRVYENQLWPMTLLGVSPDAILKEEVFIWIIIRAFYF